MAVMEQVLAAHPAVTGPEPRLLADAVARLTECASVCLACADACVAEPAHDTGDMRDALATCVRRDQDCADICTVAARVLARPSGRDEPTAYAVVEAARTALRACGAACVEMADMDHCWICAETCRDTEAAMTRLLADLRPSDPYPAGDAR